MVDFKIISDNQEINLSQDDLFTQILNQAFSELEHNAKIINVEEYVATINQLIETSNKDKLNISLKQIYSIYFLSGYFYKIFMSKNNVKIHEG